MIPQLLFRFTQYVNIDNNNVTQNINESFSVRNERVKSLAIIMVRSDPYKDNGEFRLGNIFTGEVINYLTYIRFCKYFNRK